MMNTSRAGYWWKVDKSTHRVGVAIAFLVTIAFASCKPPEPNTSSTATEQKSAQGKGIVRAIDPTHLSITLDHEKMPGLREAETLGCTVSDVAMLQDVMIGDTVLFTMTQGQGGNCTVTSLEPIGFNPVLDSSTSGTVVDSTGHPARRPRRGRPK